MPKEVDFMNLVENFTTGNSSNDAIKSIYDIIPTLSQEQTGLLMQMQYFINKYSLDDVKNTLEELLQRMYTNKNLNFLSSNTLKSLLKAYTQSELVRGINITSKNSNTPNG
jgi:type III secretory pathway component EscR